MSRTAKGQPSPGADWWGKRPLAGTSAHSNKPGTMKFLKRWLHKIERRNARREIEQGE